MNCLRSLPMLGMVVFPLVAITGCSWHQTAPPVPGVAMGALKLWVDTNPPTSVGIKGKLIQAPPNQSNPEGVFVWVNFSKTTETDPYAGTAWRAAGIDPTTLDDTYHIEIWSYYTGTGALIKKETEGDIDYEGGEYTLGY